MTNPTLQELNAHLFAQLLPDTHARPEARAAASDQPKGTGKGKGAKPAATAAAADTAPPAPQYTAEQLAVLTAAGITDPAAADAGVVAALLGN